MDNIANLEAALKLPWFQGSITDTELGATEWIRWLDEQSEKGRCCRHSYALGARWHH